jgi:hypothetical protein
VRAYLRDVEASATRAADLTGQMLAYAGKARREPRCLDLSKLVADVSRLVEPSILFLPWRSIPPRRSRS